MTVRELIIKLEEYDDDMEIVVYKENECNAWYAPGVELMVVKLIIEKKKGGYKDYYLNSKGKEYLEIK